MTRTGKRTTCSAAEHVRKVRCRAGAIQHRAARELPRHVGSPRRGVCVHYVYEFNQPPIGQLALLDPVHLPSGRGKKLGRRLQSERQFCLSRQPAHTQGFSK